MKKKQETRNPFFYFILKDSPWTPGVDPGCASCFSASGILGSFFSSSFGSLLLPVLISSSLVDRRSIYIERNLLLSLTQTSWRPSPSSLVLTTLVTRGTSFYHFFFNPSKYFLPSCFCWIMSLLEKLTTHLFIYILNGEKKLLRPTSWLFEQNNEKAINQLLQLRKWDKVAGLFG